MLYALGHDAVAGFQSFLNDPHGAEAFADFHRLNADFVLAVEEGYLIAALKFCNRTLRDQEGILLDSRLRTHFAVSAGAQNIPRVWKQPRDPDRAGALIHFAIREVDLPPLWIGRTVSQDQRERHQLPLRLPAS